MSNYFANTFDNWCDSVFVQQDIFPPRRFQCDLNDRNTVLSVNNWQGARFCDNFVPWNIDGKYDNFGWCDNFNDCKRCVPCKSCEPCKECEPCKPCEPCKVKCEEEKKKCEPCNFKWEDEKNFEKDCEKDFNWEKNNCKTNRKGRKFDWDNKRQPRRHDREKEYVYWTADKDLWPHDYLPWEEKGKEAIKKKY